MSSFRRKLQPYCCVPREVLRKIPVYSIENYCAYQKIPVLLVTTNQSVKDKTLKKAIIITVLALLFINFVLGPIILFVINNLFPVLIVGAIGFFCLRHHDRKRSGSKKK